MPRFTIGPAERLAISQAYAAKPAGMLWPHKADLIERGLCTSCKEYIGSFKDLISKKEYAISGMCQGCQDNTFVDPDPEMEV